ncbi:DUF1592 domain-containing protein [Verrucomicrobiaceae bacterium 227]
MFRLQNPFILVIAAIARLEAAPDAIGFVEHYCIDCHGDGMEKGGLDLGEILEADPAGHRKTWEHALLRLDTRQMPPPGKDRPDETEYQKLVADLEGYLDGLAARNPDPGVVPTIRRLTRTEYQNAIRDLLKVNLDVTELLPKDESSHGFDNITVGTLSPTLLNRYVGVAQKVARIAVGQPLESPDFRVIRVPADQSQSARLEGLPYGTRGGVLFDHPFPVTAEYDFEIRLTRDRDEQVEGLTGGKHEVEILIDGEAVSRFEIKRPKGRDHSKVDARLKVRLKVPAGARQVAVTFVKKPDSILETKRKPYDAQYNVHRHPRQAPAVFQVTINGPYGEQTSTETASRQAIFQSDSPEENLRRLMRLAYRRSVTDEEVAAIMPFHEQGMEMAIAAILVSPRFLFRIESGPSELPSGEVYRLDDLALASRLSFFLWSSLPDDELLTAKLSDPAVMEAQVRRMLADSRASSLVTNFANQWLHLRNLGASSPDLRLFPDFDDNLRQSFKRETELFFESILKEDRPVADLLKADYTFLNERLAKHYGIPHIYGSDFRRVKLEPSSHRGGLLRHGSILTVTSYGTRTSPSIRGNWILENILGTPAPPPPPDTPALDDVVVDDSLPMREKLAAHRDKPACAGCHKLMDPVGFSLEEYDAVGRWMTREVDASGGLPDGQKFIGTTGLEDGLRKRPDLFARTLTEKMLTYALGRGVEYFDAPAIRGIVDQAAPSNYRLSDLITGIAKSPPFTHRKKP